MNTVSMGAPLAWDGKAATGSPVNVHMADAVRVAHDRDLGVRLYAAHQGVAATRDHLQQQRGKLTGQL